MKRSTRFRSRHGTLTLEAAMVCPLILLIVGGAIDIGQYVNVAQIASNSAREGSLMASRNETKTVSQVKATIRDCFSDAMPGMTESELDAVITVHVKNQQGQTLPNNDMDSIPSGESVTIQIAFDFEEVRWLGGITFWSMKPVSTTAVSRRE